MPRVTFLSCSHASWQLRSVHVEQAQLTHADREDVVQSLAYALRYNRSGKRVSDRDIMTSQAAAEHLIETLTRAGYVIMRKPPLPAHSAPSPPHAHLYDPERFSKPPEDTQS